MTGRLPSSGKPPAGSLGDLLKVVAPIVIILVALPFVQTAGTQYWFTQALVMGFGLSALSIVALYAVFALSRPRGWRSRAAVVMAEMITLWLAAGITVAHTI